MLGDSYACEQDHTGESRGMLSERRQLTQSCLCAEHATQLRNGPTRRSKDVRGDDPTGKRNPTLVPSLAQQACQEWTTKLRRTYESIPKTATVVAETCNAESQFPGLPDAT